MVELPPEEIDTSVVIDNYGIDSVQATVLSGELEEWLGRTLSETVVWDYPTIDLLAAHLAGDATSHEETFRD
jgi:acyl carrier protein